MSTADVRSYWQASPCAAKLARHEAGTAGFYHDIEQAKSRIEPHEVPFAGFPEWRGKAVLEIGCGVGVDTARFARAGAEITAVDLTEAAVSLANRLLELEQLPGKAVVADAEELPFDDGSFDLVYSWGVLHHTPHIDRALAEVRRVLRPDGALRIMLYGRPSFFALAVWLRQMARERRVLSVREALGRGLESPGTRAFTKAEAQRMLAGFADVDVRQVATRYDRIPIDWLGWHLLIRAARPGA